MITQALYAVVFCSRYLDLFWVKPTANLWNFVLKNFYIFSSLYIIFIMMRLYARTREREKAWKLGALCFGGALLAAPLVTLIFRKWADTTFLEVRISLWERIVVLLIEEKKKGLVDVFHHPRVGVRFTPAGFVEANRGADRH